MNDRHRICHEKRIEIKLKGFDPFLENKKVSIPASKDHLYYTMSIGLMFVVGKN